MPNKIDHFDFKPGFRIANKYEVIRKLGSGWEGEVYLTREIATAIERTAKFFFPKRNPRNKTIRRYAKKLHSLRNSPVVIHYHNHETIDFRGIPISCLISEFVEGELLCDFIDRQPGKRIHWYMALHLLHAISAGLEPIHLHGEYHGDLHTGNVFIQQVGTNFRIKLIDVFDWRDSKPQNIRKDVCDLVRIFYDMLGGQKHYPNQSEQIKAVCCGLKTTLINKKFRNAGFLRQYIENIPWELPK
jgi:serine/threonine protein kinase